MRQPSISQLLSEAPPPTPAYQPSPSQPLRSSEAWIWPSPSCTSGAAGIEMALPGDGPVKQSSTRDRLREKGAGEKKTKKKNKIDVFASYCYKPSICILAIFALDECFDTCVIALRFKRECRRNMYDMWMAVLALRVGGWEGEVIHHMNY